MGKLKRQLGFVDVFSIATGAMISSGLFVLPGIAFAKAGSAMLSKAEPATVLWTPDRHCTSGSTPSSLR